MARRFPPLIALSALFVLLPHPRSLPAAEPDARGIELYEAKIRPALVEHCYKCHSSQARQAKKLRGGLLLDSRADLLKGGDSGPAIVSGKPAESRLLKALRHEDELKMPPQAKLPDAVIADFATWIAMGAPTPRDGAAGPTVAAIDWTKARQFWAFQLPVKHPQPAVRNARWPRKESDFFLLAELEKRNLTPARPAGKQEWLRRATFDLIGLPPTPEEVAAFLQDDSPDAFGRVVDRLLSSPHYGERWARYWLDVARYAEDKALAIAKPSPQAFRYRDWVVQAFNTDMPYDEFLRLQLAGDLLPATADSFKRLAGLGFQGLGAEYHKGNFAAQVMADELDDRVDTLTRGLLGLTVACARCHDHKYDPIPTRDYYSLASAYQGSSLADIPIAPAEEVARFKTWQQEQKNQEAALAKTKDKTLQGELKAKLEQHKKQAPQAPVVIHGVQGGGQPMRVHVRGRVENLGEEAPPGFLRIFRADAGAPAKTFTRLDLANAIATDRNPLTARVIVNRVWQHHFGRGVVGTPSNFGKLGDRPTHPELLDTMAVRFIESGWSIKWLHREIMLSAAYQLSSESAPANAAVDPDNHYLWRMSPRRLDFEPWRDALLLVSGRLDAAVGGPSLDLNDRKNVRRTIYARVSRSILNPTLAAFDFPDANVSSDHRSVTTVPQQQLFALNSDFMIDTARAFSARLEKAAKEDDKRIVLGFQLAFGRSPTNTEKNQGLEFLRVVAESGARDRLTPWEQYAQALLAANEFIWVD
jgi:Protein of unknown function (DUF1553)/Protein of unknown function (DUF1549)/Planctomycete cytochrome C